MSGLDTADSHNPPAPRDAPALTSLADAMAAGLDQPTRVVCRVTNLYAPEALDGKIRHRVELRGQSALDLRPVDSMPFSDPLLRSMTEWAHLNGVLVVASGAFVSEVPARGKGRGAPVRFRLDGLKPLDCVLPLLSPTYEEIDATEALFQRLRQEPDGIYQHLSQTYFRRNHIAAESLSVRQHRALRLVALQSLSCGMLPSNNHNPRLSVLLTSSPGRSKKTLVEFASALAPSFAWVQPAETTPAGLFAYVTQRGGGFHVSPGSIPKTHMGTCVVDDAHRLLRQHKNALQGGLMAIVEDGCINLTKAGSARYDATTALLLTGNPGSKVPGMAVRRQAPRDQGITGQRAEDLGLPLDLLSRLDVVVWLDGDADPLESAQEMASRSLAPAEPRGPKEASEDRELKLLVAHLRDRFPMVDIDGVGAALERAMGDLGGVLREYMAPASCALEADSLVRRISNSLRKLTGAAARLNGRGVATEADVEEAFAVMTLKLEVLRWMAGDVEEIRPLLPRPELVGRARQQRALRRQQVRRRYGGRRVDEKEIAAGLGLKEQLVRRELWGMGLKPQEGKWAVPTEEEYDLRQEAEAQAAALRRSAARARGEPEEEAADDDDDARVARLLRTMDDSEFAWEAPLPGGAELAFKDCLPAMPVDLRPYMKALGNIDAIEQQTLQMEVAMVAMVEHKDCWSVTVETMDERVPLDAGRRVAVTLQPEMNRLLRHPDWETRGLNALALLWESPLGRDPMVLDWLRFEQKYGLRQRPPVPVRLQEGLEALCRRLEAREQARRLARERGLNI